MSFPGEEAIAHLRNALELGRSWPTALLESMALWTVPQEIFEGRHLKYFIEGEAFDWLLLAERLCSAVDGLIPPQEKEDLLFSGQFPVPIAEDQIKDLLGVEKYRGYLNYFYGVTAEEALQLAVEQQVYKRHLSNGIQYQGDFSEDAHARIYRAPRSLLLRQFREEKGYAPEESMTLTEDKEFTYWLFKYRLEISDKAKVASDTKKALDHYERMRTASRSSDLWRRANVPSGFSGDVDSLESGAPLGPSPSKQSV